MNIIEWLTSDHVRLREELVDIRQSLSQVNLRERLNLFISNYEMHEEIEDELLFPYLDKIEPKHPYYKPLSDCKNTHEKIWPILEQMVDALNAKRVRDLQKTFYNFSASVETHFRYEERVLFPCVRELLNEETLNNIALKAEAKITHTMGPSQKNTRDSNQ